MVVFTYHLVRTTPFTTIRAMVRPPVAGGIDGLRHAECLSAMRLGSPLLSPARVQLRNLSMFASWESEDAIDSYLADSQLGHVLSGGWHVRLDFLRRWGHIDAFKDLPESTGETDPDEPVVALTIARMKLPQVPRFIQWGKPVESLVRDDPQQTLALAALRLPRTVSTFSVWQSAAAMENMVRGHSSVPQPSRHADAMVERTRKDFHFEFTTLRFRCLSEHGSWNGRTDIVAGTHGL